MPRKDLKKAQKAKVDAFNNLGLKRDQATKVLEDLNRMNSERIPRGYLSKLQSASKEYEASIRAVLAVLEDEEQKKSYTDKLTKQLADLDPLLEGLHLAVNIVNSEEEVETPIPTNNNKRIFSYMQMKVHTAEKTINTKLQLVWDAEKQPETNTVLYKVTANIRLLEDVLNLVNKDVDIILNQIITAELTDAQAKELTDRITILVETANNKAALLKVNLLQAKAALRPTASATLSPLSEGSVAGSSFLLSNQK